MRSVAFTRLAIFFLVLFASAGMAEAEDIGGTISVTKTLFQDSRLVGNVTCTMTDSACIVFGASGIKLSLNGFTISGPGKPDETPDPANPAAFCNATPAAPTADGISISNQTDVQVLGPGMVQEFRRHAIFIGTSTNVRIAQLTSHHNCFSGLFTTGMSNSVIEDVVSVRNSNNSGPATCGGNCNNGSNNNAIRRNYFGGNGSVANGSNDFGVSLLAGSSNNRIEDNTIGGNTNGIYVAANALGNVIRRNVIAGNPPAQLSRTFPGDIGVDIRDLSTVAGAGARNTFQGNWCVTYSGPGPAACPNLTVGGAPTTVPSAVGLTFSANPVKVGASFTATLSGNNLTSGTFVDLRFRRPGATTDEVATNWQQGSTATHSAGTAEAGIWMITGVRAHQELNDAAGPFITVSVPLTVVP
ncbi:MAG: right-handed parallel beta-helix repeat-containing protein [Acidobacteria bacterium]|nr:right-handed parallel beta-helix repeat-containing protein [Acidobacteriota bacterium]